ncbi:MAG: GntR family transcriptional regulator [Nocardioides sp.]
MAAKFDRIAADIRHRIESADLKPGDRLPAETALVADYNVSLGTLRRALDVLEAEQFIERVQGKGTFVRGRRARLERSAERYQWERDRVQLGEQDRRATGASERDTGLRIDDLAFTARYERAEADADLAATFGVELATPILRRTYWTRAREEAAPFVLVVSHLLVRHVEANPLLMDERREPWPGGTQHQLSTVGIEVDRITDRVFARPATVDEAREFDVFPGAPLVIDRKVSYTGTGEVVEVADNTWPADRIALTFHTYLK